MQSLVKHPSNSVLHGSCRRSNGRFVTPAVPCGPPPSNLQLQVEHQSLRPQCSSSTSSGAATQERSTQAPHQPPKSVDDALREAEALLDSIVSGGGAPTLASADLGYTDFGYFCDGSGCVLAVQQESRNTTELPFIRLSGANWNIGLVNSPTASQTPLASTDMSTDASDFGFSSSSSSCEAEVTGPSWRVGLTAADLADYLHMLSQLRMAVASLRFQGLWQGGNKDRPPSRAKWAGRDVRLTAVFALGEPGFSIEMTFEADGRAVVAKWPADVTAAVIAALDDELGLRPLAVRGT